LRNGQRRMIEQPTTSGESTRGGQHARIGDRIRQVSLW
jgi:hypothetical protein